MINILKKLFEDKNTTKISEINNLELLCGLMVEAANSDGVIDKAEISKISSVLVETFNENASEVDAYLNKAVQNSNNSRSLFFYTSKINKIYSDEKKILLIETLWEIILSDGQIHDYESSLLRRLSGLLYISDLNSGNARKRALNKISDKK